MSEEAGKEFKCDHCGGRLMRSREWIMTGYPYWLRPWGSTLRMSEMIIPWACMECGRVTYILRDFHKIKRDYDALSDKERKDAYESF